MLYTIFHLTKFQYSEPITESLMEIRMRPRNDVLQICKQFSLSLKPSARYFVFEDYHGNLIHHFDIPRKHTHLEIQTEALVEVFPSDPLPAALQPDAWETIDNLTFHPAFWEFTIPSYFAKPTESLVGLARELELGRDEDPLTVLKKINNALHKSFEYAQGVTGVDSPIDEAIAKKSGVCQDFANIMIALARQLKIPSRYVSGYLFHRTDDRSHLAQDATHAWVEAYLPSIGWTGFDPTNNLICGERHIRVAIGRDYADVPPTKGIFKGNASSELTVAVRVANADSDKLETKAKTAIKPVNFQASEPTPVSVQDQQQ